MRDSSGLAGARQCDLSSLTRCPLRSWQGRSTMFSPAARQGAPDHPRSRKKVPSPVVASECPCSKSILSISLRMNGLSRLLPTTEVSNRAIAQGLPIRAAGSGPPMRSRRARPCSAGTPVASENDCPVARHGLTECNPPWRAGMNAFVLQETARALRGIKPAAVGRWNWSWANSEPGVSGTQ